MITSSFILNYEFCFFLEDLSSISNKAAFFKMTESNSTLILESSGNNEIEQLFDALQFFLCTITLRLPELISLDKNLTVILIDWLSTIL